MTSTVRGGDSRPERLGSTPKRDTGGRSLALVPPAVAGGEAAVVATPAPRSAIAAVAVEIAEVAGGTPGPRVVIGVSSGIFGAACGPPPWRRAADGTPRAVGFALALASHGIGRAPALRMAEGTGAGARVGMVANALQTTAVAPIALGLRAWRAEAPEERTPHAGSDRTPRHAARHAEPRRHPDARHRRSRAPAGSRGVLQSRQPDRPDHRHRAGGDEPRCRAGRGRHRRCRAS
ncbi:MAG: hypothetical protein GVY33_09215 [Alphaproteobacteria bacterium]|nr:hypothetical protein [Alphaproteobacteria bacterium]